MRFPALSLLLLLALSPAAAQTLKVLAQSSPLAGFQFHAGNRLWPELRQGDPLSLIREPDNPHDRQAVRVEWRGQHLGYLPRAENRTVAAEIDAGHRVSAKIARLREHRNPWQRVLVDIYLEL